MKELFDQAPKPVNDIDVAPIETESRGSWSEEQIESAKVLAKELWKDLNRSNADLVYERVMQESFPGLSSQAIKGLSVRMLTCIHELAVSEYPDMVQQITPEQFTRFASLYLTEKLG